MLMEVVRAASGALDAVSILESGAGALGSVVAALSKRGGDDQVVTVKGFGSAVEWSAASRRSAWLATAGQQEGGGKFVFDVDKFYQCVARNGNQRYGSILLYSHVLASTQTIIHDTPELPSGTVCVADMQTKGRGRGSNTWTSPPGCLLFSFACSVAQANTLPLVQYLVCLALVQGIKSLPGMESVDVGIKWPNDIYANRSTKIGGVLCQSTILGQQIKITIGVGLNVDNAEPSTCLNQLAAGTGGVSREQVLAAFLQKYEALHTEFEQQGWTQSIQHEYERLWLHTGQRVVLESEGNRPVVIQGIVPQSGGCLLAKDESSQQLFELYPDGNRLDFFQGLISKRIQ